MSCERVVWSWGRGTLAGERGVGRVPIPTREHILWYSLYKRYFVGNAHEGGKGVMSVAFFQYSFNI